MDIGVSLLVQRALDKRGIASISLGVIVTNYYNAANVCYHLEICVPSASLPKATSIIRISHPAITLIPNDESLYRNWGYKAAYPAFLCRSSEFSWSAIMRHAHEPPSLDPRPVPDRHLFLVPDSLYGLDLLNPSTVVKLPRALLRDLEADAAPIFEPRCPTDPQAALPLSIHLFANSSLECARCRRQAAELRFPKLVPLVLGALRQYFAIKASMKTEEEASAVTGMGVVLQHAVDGMDLDEEWVDRHFFETREAGDSSLRIGRGRLYLTGQEMGALRRAVTTAKSSRLPMWPEDAITESIWTKEEAQFVRRIPGRDSPFAPAGGFFAVLRARVCGYLAVLLRSLKRLLSGLLQLRAH